MDAYTLINIVLLCFLIITAVAVAVIRNLLTATILLSVYSLLMAAMYLVLGAPDVAITEAAIGAGISTILLLAALLLTGEKEKASETPGSPLFVIAFTGIALIYATLGMPSFGDPSAVTNQHVAPYYLHASGEEIGIPNVVTSILASYRGFDTLGETFVVFTAAISVLLLIGSFSTERK
ncbi:MAG: DUF4040 domain-containing protein [Rickettsiales bacterium]|nr:DUF4040 domain-containing protein [Rickettsiales bacterium]